MQRLTTHALLIDGLSPRKLLRTFCLSFPCYVSTISTFCGRATPQSDELFETVCAGCPGPCNACDFDEWVPSCSTLSEAGVAHASSPGGDTRIEDLVIEKGYWRATKTSSTVLACYNEDACPGGITNGSCSPGYNGPCKYSPCRYISRGDLSVFTIYCVRGFAALLCLARGWRYICLLMTLQLRFSHSKPSPRSLLFRLLRLQPGLCSQSWI